MNAKEAREKGLEKIQKNFRMPVVLVERIEEWCENKNRNQNNGVNTMLTLFLNMEDEK